VYQEQKVSIFLVLQAEPERPTRSYEESTVTASEWRPACAPSERTCYSETVGNETRQGVTVVYRACSLFFQAVAMSDDQ
jgi:hypothetical protein